jgi:hypothetical protein
MYERLVELFGEVDSGGICWTTVGAGTCNLSFFKPLKSYEPVVRDPDAWRAVADAGRSGG